jgi:hypothetical protein
MVWLWRSGNHASAQIRASRVDYRDVAETAAIALTSDQLLQGTFEVPDELTQGLIAYDLAKKHRLKHVVYHSVFRAEHFKDVPHLAKAPQRDFVFLCVMQARKFTGPKSDFFRSSESFAQFQRALPPGSDSALSVSGPPGAKFRP